MGRVLLTGRPAAGKTTLCTRVLEELRERGEPVAGFTTHEISRGGRRTGFVVTGVSSGRERTMATAGGPVGGRAVMVGRYGVDVATFEDVALIELEAGMELGATIVVDEIGKMELLSERFRQLLPKLFDAERLLATVHMHADPLTDSLKARPDVSLITVGPANRDRLVSVVLERVLAP